MFQVITTVGVILVLPVQLLLLLEEFLLLDLVSTLSKIYSSGINKNSDNIEELNVAEDEHMFDLSDLASIEVIPAKDKGKGIMQEPEKPVKVKGKDQIEHDADVAQRLQAELDEEARLEREREDEASNAALIEEWDSIKAKIDADAQLAQRLQAKERE
ncbi:hypothetical protein Tco_1343888 [Tanacetum coccineum]